MTTLYKFIRGNVFRLQTLNNIKSIHNFEDEFQKKIRRVGKYSSYFLQIRVSSSCHFIEHVFEKYNESIFCTATI